MSAHISSAQNRRPRLDDRDVKCNRVGGSYASRDWFENEAAILAHVNEQRHREKLVDGVYVPSPELHLSEKWKYYPND